MFGVPPSSSMEIALHCWEARLHGRSVIKPSWKMYQRQLHKTSIYFLRSENTTRKKIPTYRCKTKENHNLTAREQTNPNWKYCTNRKCDNFHTPILIMWQTADAQPGRSGVRWRPGRFPGESGAAEPWGNAPMLNKEYQKANFGV